MVVEISMQSNSCDHKPPEQEQSVYGKAYINSSWGHPQPDAPQDGHETGCGSREHPQTVVAITNFKFLGTRTKKLWIRTQYANGSCNHSLSGHKNEEVVHEDSIYKQSSQSLTIWPRERGGCGSGQHIQTVVAIIHRLGTRT